MSGAQIALRLLSATASATASSASTQVGPAATGDVRSPLDYAREAGARAAQAQGRAFADDAAGPLPEGWLMGNLVAIDSLEPEYRDFAQRVGATHVRLINRAPVADADFDREVRAHLDEAYAGDAAYLAAKSAGQVSLRRTSDVLVELGDMRAGEQTMAFHRGPNGSEHVGSGHTGIPSPAFQSWWSAQNEAGNYVAVGGTMGLGFVASWAADRGAGVTAAARG